MFKTDGLLPVYFRVEQLKLGHMFNIVNVNAPEYLRTNVEMIHHRYSKEPATWYVFVYFIFKKTNDPSM